MSKEPDTHQQPVRDRDWKRLAWSSLDKFISHAAESCGDEVGPALAKLCTFGARCVAAYFFLRSGLVPDPAHLAEIVRAAL